VEERQTGVESKANWRGESKPNWRARQTGVERARQTQVESKANWRRLSRGEQAKLKSRSCEQIHRNLLSAFKNCVLASCVGQNTVFSRTGGEEWDENTTPQRKALIAQARCCGGGRAETTRQAKNAMSFSPLELEG
jgi:hypothetical protein